MAILGISAYYHDAAAAIVNEGGSIIAAAQEERFTRIKHDKRFPLSSVRYCLDEAGESIEHVAFYERPDWKLERILKTYSEFASKNPERSLEAFKATFRNRTLTSVDSLKTKLSSLLGESFDLDSRLSFVPHHASHAASAFYPSPFSKAAILTIDGVGEWATTSISRGAGNFIELLENTNFPNSVGLLYSAFTYYCGFKVNSGEYKLMGLAPYGSPVFVKQILDNIVELRTDGTFSLNPDYFESFLGETPISLKLTQLLEKEPRKRNQPLLQFHADIAASIQSVTEKIVSGLAKRALQMIDTNCLTIAGGVGLNCVANGCLLREIPKLDLWVQPAAGDAGGATGAALFLHHQVHQSERHISAASETMNKVLLGPDFSDEDIRTELTRIGAQFTHLSEKQKFEKTADLLVSGSIIGWFQGRMEFGPRALGNRSILADPRSKTAQETINARIKQRESFRPFAPAVMEEHLKDWFKEAHSDPFMLTTRTVTKATTEKLDELQDAGMEIYPRQSDSPIPAVTHLDGSARAQSVGKQSHPCFHRLLETFFDKTDCPLLLNTSFNVRGEPIVCSIEDAYRCFLNASLDFLVIGNFILDAKKQDYLSKLLYYKEFPQD